MTLHSAADLIAALRPFVGERRGARLAGLERLFRHSSHLTSEIRAVRRSLPSRRPVPRAGLLERTAELVAAANGTHEENSIPVTTGVHATADVAEASNVPSLMQATPRPKSHSWMAKPLMLFLILLLLLMGRGSLSPARALAAGSLASHPPSPPQL